MEQSSIESVTRRSFPTSRRHTRETLSLTVLTTLFFPSQQTPQHATFFPPSQSTPHIYFPRYCAITRTSVHPSVCLSVCFHRMIASPSSFSGMRFIQKI